MVLSKIFISIKMKLRSGRIFGEEEDDFEEEQDNLSEIPENSNGSIQNLRDSSPVLAIADSQLTTNLLILERSTNLSIRLLMRMHRFVTNLSVRFMKCFIRAGFKFIRSIPTLLGVIGGVLALLNLFNKGGKALNLSFVTIDGEMYSINKIN